MFHARRLMRPALCLAGLVLALTSPASAETASYSTVDLPGVRMAYLDTGGDDETVVLLHAAAGTSEHWKKQIGPIAEAGYRVIAYDRRGVGQSDPMPDTGPQPGIASEDLAGLVDALGLEQFHLITIAGGGGVAIDYAAQHQDRLQSLVLAATHGSLDEPDIKAFQKVIRHPAVTWPHPTLEIGASYAGENPEGVAEWMEIHERARSRAFPFQGNVTPNTYAKMQGITVPTLLVAADADQLSPPGLMRMLGAQVKGHEWAMIPEAGHSVAWEKPEEFNRIVLEFIGRH